MCNPRMHIAIQIVCVTWLFSCVDVVVLLCFVWVGGWVGILMRQVVRRLDHLDVGSCLACYQMIGGLLGGGATNTPVGVVLEVEGDK